MATQTTQIRVSPKTHRALRRLSKETDVPVTKIVAKAVDRLLREKSATHTMEGTAARDGQPSPPPRDS